MRTYPHIHWILFISILSTSSTPLTSTAAYAAGQLGQPTPEFALESVTGKHYNRRSFMGKPTLFVIGRTRRSAPPCRQWSVSLLEQLKGSGAELYQIIVADKPWYLTRGIVRNEIKKFIPKGSDDRVLIEWDEKFAIDFGIVKDDTPRLILIDERGIVRWRYAGVPNATSLKNATAMVHITIAAQKQRLPVTNSTGGQKDATIRAAP